MLKLETTEDDGASCVSTWTEKIGDDGLINSNRSDDSGPCPLVLVEWEDSTQPVSSWQWITAYKEPDIVTCASVGWLIYDGDDVKALAPNLGHSDDQRAVQVSGVIRIPARCVTRITELVERNDSKKVSSSLFSSEVLEDAMPGHLAAE